MRALLLTLTTCLFVVPAYAKYSGGTGEPNDPHQIATAADLIALGETPEDYDKHFILTADIDLDPNLAGGKVFDKAVIAPAQFDFLGGRPRLSGAPFTGVFDGNGHTILHLTITGGRYLGLFGRLGSTASVSNLGLRAQVSGTANYVGGLVGSNGGAVTQCYNSSAVRGEGHVGGLVGSNGGSVATSYCTAMVNGKDSVGGLVGDNEGTVTRCYSSGAVRGERYVGGLVGSNHGSVLHSVWDIETSGLLGSSGGVGLTTAEMEDPQMLGLNGFANDPNWVLDAGHDYPRLAWEGTVGQVISEPNMDWLEGTGTEEDPYRVDTAERLTFLGRASGLCGRHFVLGADIDLDPNLTNGQVFPQAVIPTLTGVFDGNGHCISHLTIRGGSGLGLFGHLTSGAEVRNLGVVDVNITGSGDYVGGLVGSNRGAMAQCYSIGTVAGTEVVGGLAGDNEGTVTQCYSSSAAHGEGDVGGLVGSNWGTVSDCYSMGAVSGTATVGGLVGFNNESAVTRCYSTGEVSSTYDVMGGLVGSGWPLSVTASFWDIQSSGQATSAGGTRKRTAGMQMAKTFLDAGWDFVGETANGTDDIWWIDEGQDYPRLWWERGDETP